MKQMSKREVVYKDTFNFRLFPEYNYSKAQKRRIRLFQGRVEHYRAAINYADSFNDPNCINLLYMIGYHPKIKNYVEKTSNNVVILCAKIPSNLLQIYDNYWELIEKFRAGGYADKNGNLQPIYYEERATREKYRSTGTLMKEVYEQHDPEDQLVDTYEMVKGQILDSFSNYTVIDKLGPERKITHEELDKLIRQYFPYGREQCGVGEKAYISLRKMDDALDAGLHRADASKLLDLPVGADCYTACKKAIRRCQMNLNVSLRNDGTVDLVKLMERMKNPPYGWDDDPHSAYCFGYAISEFLDGTWVWDEVCCFPTQEAIKAVLRNILRGSLGRRHSYILVSESGYRLSSRISYIFGIEDDSYTPRDDVDKKILGLMQIGLSERKIAAQLGNMSNVAVHKRISKMQTAQIEGTPFCNLAVEACQRVRNLTRWPVALVDEHLQEVLCGTYDSENHISIPVFGKNAVSSELFYFTLEKCRALKEKISTINEDIPDMIRQRYGADADIEEIQRWCTTTDSGWLWSSKTFWECVDRFVKNRNQS